MSQDSNSGSAGKPSSPSAAPTSGAVSKRPSLKELAARASQAGASSATSKPSVSTPPPPSTDSVPQDKPARQSTPIPSVPPPKASVPPPRPIEAGKEDSGRVDLNAINQAATPEQVAAAAAAKPAAHDLVDDAKADAKAEDKPAADDGAKVKNIADARAKKTAKKKSEAAKTNEAAKESEAAPAALAEPVKKAESEGGGGGKWIAIVAVLGLAAGGFLFYKNKQQPPPAPVAAVVQEKPDTTPVVTDTQKIAEEPKPASTGLSIDSLPAAEPADSAKAPAKVAAAPAEDNAAPAPAPTPEPAVPTALPTASGIGKKPGDLSSAMAEAVGGSTEKPVNADDATPAAAKTGSQTIPEQPPQGSVAAAIRSVAPGAKACVAGADEPSSASVTFNSSGAVSSVSVSGWAAKNGKSECVKAALKGANVGPFAKPSFTVGVPIRP